MLVFIQAMLGAVAPGPDESRSYARWLSQRAACPDCSAMGTLALACRAHQEER
ncbi:MAG: hypothetical protein ACLQB1_40605 [Streptosporangiaceae bacterium]